MPAVCIYFQIHQPYRLNKYSIFDIGDHKDYFDAKLNKKLILKVSEKCYIPALKIIKELVISFDNRFRIAFSPSGTVLEQLRDSCPEVIRLLQDLATTGSVEFLAETYYHTLASLYSPAEFKAQVDQHKQIISDLFGSHPTTFRNTELLYSDKIAKNAEQMGFKAILAEGAEKMIGKRSPNKVYRPKGTKKIKVLLKNYKLSDDIAFRFSDKNWKEYPIDAAKFAQWISSDRDADCINLFMDFETFGEHHWQGSGIFKFLKELPSEILKDPKCRFVTPCELASVSTPVGFISTTDTISWADNERDTSAWDGNTMQKSALKHLYDIEKTVVKINNPKLLDTWRRLQTSDHFYYMCTKWFSDGDVHKYFNPYDSPYDSFIAMMNILNDFKIMISTENSKINKSNSKKGKTKSAIIRTNRPNTEASNRKVTPAPAPLNPN